MTENRPTDYQLALDRLRSFSDRNRKEFQEGNSDILQALFMDVVIYGSEGFPAGIDMVSDTRVPLLEKFTIQEEQPDKKRCYIKCESGHVFYIGAKTGAFLDQLMRAEGTVLTEEDFRKNPTLCVNGQAGATSLYFLLQNYSSEVNRQFRTSGIIGLNDSIIQHKRGSSGYWYAAR